jgi:spore coat protein A
MTKPKLSPTQFYALRFTDELAFPKLIKLDSDRKRVHIKQSKINLHSALEDTPIWCYAVNAGMSEVINPSFEVESSVTAKLEWVNDLAYKTLPIVAATVEYLESDGTAIPQNSPGMQAQTLGRQVDIGVRKADDSFMAINLIPPVAATHLHGGNTEANSDGWTENTVSPGQVQLDQYGNRQPSTLLWYHDHAMHITRLNVYAGLAGLYFIRDNDDRRIMNALHLRCDDDERPKYELPILIQDCNLDVDDTGHLASTLLHKVESGEGPMEFFGPYTMVNKKIWPKCTVKRRQYRLRLINGSNARTYRLTLIADNDVTKKIAWSTIARQIGTDGGLLANPIDPGSDIVLAPAERLDLIVDFGAINAQSLTVINTAPAPYNGNDAPLDPSLGEATDPAVLTARVRYPEVMRFDLTGTPHSPRAIPALSDSFRRIVHEPSDADPGEQVVALPDTGVPGHHNHRYIALVEEMLAATDQTAMLTLRELLPYTPTPNSCDSGATLPIPEMERLITITEPDPNNPGTLLPPKTYRTAAKLFHDSVNFVGNLGEIEVWKVINLSPDTHPLHIHLSQLQVLGRVVASDPATMIPDPATLDWLDLCTPVSVTLDTNVDIQESDRAWKDVIRIDPGQMVKIAVPLGTIDPITNTIKAEGFCGRYMYHCHILEHEDHDMMRPFVVLDKAIAALMRHQH